jgi:hypothetical protein
MTVYEQTFDKSPDTIIVPPEFRERAIGVIIFPLDKEEDANRNLADTEIAKFFGSIPDFPERESQGEYEEQEFL